MAVFGFLLIVAILVCFILLIYCLLKKNKTTTEDKKVSGKSESKPNEKGTNSTSMHHVNERKSSSETQQKGKETPLSQTSSNESNERKNSVKTEPHTNVSNTRENFKTSEKADPEKNKHDWRSEHGKEFSGNQWIMLKFFING